MGMDLSAVYTWATLRVVFLNRCLFVIVCLFVVVFGGVFFLVILFWFVFIFVLISLKTQERCPGHTPQLTVLSRTLS